MNFEKQAEEIEVLLSIYGDDWKTDTDSAHSYNLKLEEGGRCVTLHFTLPEDYPSEAPPSIEISAPSLSRMQKEEINNALNSMYLDNVGEMVLYQWVEKVREILQSFSSQLEDDKKSSKSLDTKTSIQLSPVPCPDIIHGETVEDRKSIFQAHVATITDPSHVNAVLWNLKLESKIAMATHNIVAWRCGKHYDCDDDGEKAAGGKLLEMLELAKLDNVVVVVTRWYGGVHLGSARFRHINNAARLALVKANLIMTKSR